MEPCPKVIPCSFKVKLSVLGFTLNLPHMARLSSNIALLSQRLGRAFGNLNVSTNLYVTPSTSQGFEVHFDDHDVFVLQLSGQKEWYIYLPTVIDLPPLYSRRFTPDASIFDSSLRHVLSPGDVLYIPRGFAHAARGFSSVSAFFGFP